MTLRLLNCGPSLRGWSHQEKILICPYQWALSYLGEPRGIPADPLIKGALVHTGLAHYWSLRMGISDLLDPVTAVQVQAANEDRELSVKFGYCTAWAKHAPLAMQAVRMYVEHGVYVQLKPVAVEHQVELWVDYDHSAGCWKLVAPPQGAAFRMQLAREHRWVEFYLLGAPWLTTFRADAVVQLADGRFAIVDHKTGYKLDVRKQNGFQASGQMLQYQMYGSLAWPAHWGGVHVGFVNLRALDKGPKAALASFQVVSRPEAVAMFPQMAGQRAEMAAGLIRQGLRADGSVDLAHFPRAFSEQGPCVNRYANCGFLERCTGAA